MNKEEIAISTTKKSSSGKSNQGSKKKNGSFSRTIGPVSDLERHLPSEWWSTLFNSVYLKTDGDVVENRAATIIEVDALIATAGLEPTDRILDLCCGQGRHCLELASRGFLNVVGVDRSRYLVRLARRRAKEQGLAVSFHEGDARKFRLKQSDFHCVALLGNSFGYFDREEDDLAVLQSTIRAMGSGGTIILDIANGDWVRENFEPRSWEWIDQDHMVCRERSLTADSLRLVSREVVIHSERGIIVDQFYAERLYSSTGIEELLQKAGFNQITNHGEFQGTSDRNQDLGMMANRMLLTAQSPRVKIPKPKPAAVKPCVTVLLGDPRQPDLCKRDGKFNEEDFETVDKLKSTLGKLEDFEFRFLDNHSTLLFDLQSNRPEFVLNFCDEGFNNDAFKELHVPAILELMGVPYTGAGPAALGVCYNKSHVRNIAQSLDIPVPLESYLDSDDHSATLPAILPAILKPNCGDSSVGITMSSVVHTPTALMSRLKSMRVEFPTQPLLVQEFLTGNEYSVGLIGNPGQGFQVLPLLEVDYSRLDPELPKILGYESKWLPDSPYWTDIRYRQADLDENSCRLLSDYSEKLFERLDCRDYARFDFRAAADGTIKLLEVNPNPGWCWDGKFFLMAEMGGLSYADLMAAIIDAGRGRYAMKFGKAAKGSVSPSARMEIESVCSS